MAERKPLLLRLSPELHEEIRRLAAADFRSVNAEIEVLLREAVQRRTRSNERPPPQTES